ncbi:MAG: zinc ribbon domain-containing protein [Anaerolineae bacterium]|nr:zinc ribbon domain-containing protein [Anaerolineae bacterium]
MDFSSIIFITGILLLVVLFVGWPLSSQGRMAGRILDPRVSGLMAERDRILDALADLDNDQLMGKLDPVNYKTQRAQLVEQGAEILHSLEPIQTGKGDKPSSTPDRASTDDPIEAMIAKRRQARQKTGEEFCGNCGEPVLTDDKFCANCGVEIT